MMRKRTFYIFLFSEQLLTLFAFIKYTSIHFLTATSSILQLSNFEHKMLQEKHPNFHKRQQPQKIIAYDALDFTLCPKKIYDDALPSEERQPNFGTKRSYTDKENQLMNSIQSAYQEQRKFSNSTKQILSNTETQIQPKQKKYAYIKNSHSLIHSQKYDLQFNDSQRSSQKKKYYQISRSQYPKMLSSQKNDIDNDLRKRELNMSFRSKDDEIEYLRKSLNEEKVRFERFQEQTIKNQIRILQTITNLQTKLRQVKSENNRLIEQNEIMKNKIKEENINMNYVPRFKTKETFEQKGAAKFEHIIKELKMEIQSMKNNLIKKEQQLLRLQKDYKRVKGVTKGMIEMMKKVDNLQVPIGDDEIKYAWRWVKKVVWEYEGIRKKAYEWKRAYDELNNESGDQLSVSQEDGY